MVAAELLGKLLIVDTGDGRTSGRIVETEAYTADDPASHSFRGLTARNAVMFGTAGRLYVYLSYGVHTCANVVTGEEGDGAAVLIRAVEPIDGVAVMRARRGAGRPLADGPGKLCQAFGIGLGDNGLDLCGGGPVALLDDGTPPPGDPIVGPRVGISKAVDVPWRWRTPTSAAAPRGRPHRS